MLFPARFWPGLADGSITVAFRRWRRPSVKSGGTLQSPVGLLAIDDVSPITVAEINAVDARSAGYGTPDEVFADLRPDGQLYRIRFRRVGYRLSPRGEAVMARLDGTSSPAPPA